MSEVDLKDIKDSLEKDQWQLVSAELVLKIICAWELNQRDMIYFRDRCTYLEDKLRELGCVVKP